MNLNTDLNAPIDSLQKACMSQRDWIRDQVERIHDRINQWEPGPMPADWRSDG